MAVRIVLWVSGFLTLIAVGMPSLVGIGFWLLVVPGFILALAPTVFIYTATFAIVRRWLPITHVVALNLIAAFITLGLGVLVTLPMALAGWLAFNLAATGDVVPHNRKGRRVDEDRWRQRQNEARNDQEPEADPHQFGDPD